MHTVKMMLAGAAVAAAAAPALARETAFERAFVATGKTCDEVNWSRRTLREFPNIASACRAVLAREGQYYARFEGEVLRVSELGRQVTVRLAGGDLMTITPPRTLSIYVDGRRTSPRDLRPGDRFDFFIPQDSLTVTFYVENPGVAPVEAPIIYEPAPEGR